MLLTRTEIINEMGWEAPINEGWGKRVGKSLFLSHSFPNYRPSWRQGEKKESLATVGPCKSQKQKGGEEIQPKWYLLGGKLSSYNHLDGEYTPGSSSSTTPRLMSDHPGVSSSKILLGWFSQNSPDP